MTILNTHLIPTQLIDTREEYKVKIKWYNESTEDINYIKTEDRNQTNITDMSKIIKQDKKLKPSNLILKLLGNL